jgi:hypothetical protein
MRASFEAKKDAQYGSIWGGSGSGPVFAGFPFERRTR